MEGSNKKEMKLLKEKRKNTVVFGTVVVICTAIAGLAKVGEVVAKKALED